MIIRRVLPHLCLAASVIMLTLYVIDGINNAMGFLRGDVFKVLLLIFIIVSLMTSVMLMAVNARLRTIKKHAGKDASKRK